MTGIEVPLIFTGGFFTMMYRLTGTSLAMVMLAGMAMAEDVKSGPEAGKNIPGAFHPLNVFNAEANAKSGQKACLV